MSYCWTTPWNWPKSDTVTWKPQILQIKIDRTVHMLLFPHGNTKLSSWFISSSVYLYFYVRIHMFLKYIDVSLNRVYKLHCMTLCQSIFGFIFIDRKNKSQLATVKLANWINRLCYFCDIWLFWMLQILTLQRISRIIWK